MVSMGALHEPEARKTDRTTEPLQVGRSQSSGLITLDTNARRPLDNRLPFGTLLLFALTKTDTLIQRFRALNVWRRGDERAPHKPLLVLYALGQLQAGAARFIPFDQLERPLERLLEEFGPPRKSPHPELPFYHLQTDGVWEIDERVPPSRRKGSKNFLRT